MSEVTRLLDAVERGEPQAAEELLPLVYEELRKLAAAWMTKEQPGQTLQPTALVHEAWLKLLGPDGGQRSWANRGHFFSAAAEAMRRILIENARRKKRLRHGGNHQRVDLNQAEIAFDTNNSDDLIALDEALTRLAVLDATKAELIKLRFFAGLNIDQAAEILGISRTTAIRHWSFARTWLLHEIKKNH